MGREILGFEFVLQVNSEPLLILVRSLREHLSVCGYVSTSESLFGWQYLFAMWNLHSGVDRTVQRGKQP
jgi:hypothetical protein